MKCVWCALEDLVYQVIVHADGLPLVASALPEGPPQSDLDIGVDRWVRVAAHPVNKGNGSDMSSYVERTQLQSSQVVDEGDDGLNPVFD